MNMIARRSNTKKLIMIGIVVLIATAAYLLVEVNFGNPEAVSNAMNLRVLTACHVHCCICYWRGVHCIPVYYQ